MCGVLIALCLPIDENFYLSLYCESLRILLSDITSWFYELTSMAN
jgi:hypothetical protein